MKPQMILGIVLAGVGVFIVLRGLNYGSDRSVMRVGDIQASVETRRAVPLWVGGVGIVGGLLLVGAAAARRGRAA
jgi:drug/metabolite transporter (DMT)-like permease